MKAGDDLAITDTYSLHEGDQLYIQLKINNGENPLDTSTATLIEFTIDRFTKIWNSDGSGEVLYNADEKTFSFPVTQKETFMMQAKSKYQVRIKFTNGDVTASNVGVMNVEESLSRNII